MVSRATTAFNEHAATECEEGGPIAFVTTWLVWHSRAQTSEESRTLRLDQHTHLWREGPIELRRDKVDIALPLNFVLVHPEPPQHDTSRTIGHLLVYQAVHYPFAPVLVTIRFMSDQRTGLNYVAALLNSPATMSLVRDTQLNRLCIDRHCELQIGPKRFQHDEPVHLRVRYGLIFNIHPPVYTVHVGNEQIVEPQWVTESIQNDGIEEAPMLPNIDDQSEFTQELFEYWDVHARTGPAHMERLLHGFSWCLHSDRVGFNHEWRPITFGDDFHAWEDQLRRAWAGILDPDDTVDFVIVQDHEPSQLHIIVHQLLRPVERATLVTTHDDGVINNHPYVTAVILPHIVGRTQMLQALHRESDCPPINPTTHCTT